VRTAEEKRLNARRLKYLQKAFMNKLSPVTLGRTNSPIMLGLNFFITVIQAARH
jgi:hypothetical protein